MSDSEIMMAKIVKDADDQLVRLPKEIHFDTDEVCIKRMGSMVVLFPKDKAWNLMAEAIAECDEDFMADRDQPSKAEEREPF